MHFNDLSARYREMLPSHIVHLCVCVVSGLESGLTYLEHLQTHRFVSLNVGVARLPVTVTPL